MESSRPATGRAPVDSNENAPNSKAVSLITGIIVLRVWNALGIQTFFQPDEYFQSLEPAWSLAFGNDSGAWLTWEWGERLRSSIHPTIFAGVYTVVDLLCKRLEYGAEDRAMLLLTAPKVVQGMLAACMDLCTYRLACKIFGSTSKQARAVLLLTLFSPWQWFCSTRTLSNCLEATLTVVALDLWPWDWFLSLPKPIEPAQRDAAEDKQRRCTVLEHTSPPGTLYAALFAAALGCILRPTNIIIWALISLLLYLGSSDGRKALKLIQASAVVGSCVLALSICGDRWFYNEWVFPPLEFLKFNAIESLAGFYGTNRVHFYVTEAFFLLLCAAAPFALVGAVQSCRLGQKELPSQPPLLERRVRATFALTIAFTIVMFSLIAHKEVRFIYPLLPMLHFLAARPLVAFFEPIWRGRKKYRGVLLGLGVALNLALGYYGSYVHQRGVIDVMHYLRHARESHYTATAKHNMSVGFLMPCHSTPWRSHLVYPEIDAWALRCEPPLRLSKEERKDYLDEADVFYVDPALWIQRNLAGEGDIGRGESKRAWPEYVVFFEQLEAVIRTALGGTEYRECWRGFNTHWHDDWRREGDVIVWCARRNAP